MNNVYRQAQDPQGFMASSQYLPFSQQALHNSAARTEHLTSQLPVPSTFLASGSTT